MNRQVQRARTASFFPAETSAGAWFWVFSENSSSIPTASRVIVGMHLDALPDGSSACSRAPQRCSRDQKQASAKTEDRSVGCAVAAATFADTEDKGFLSEERGELRAGSANKTQTLRRVH